MLVCDAMTAYPPVVSGTCPAPECRRLLRDDPHGVLAVVDGADRPLGLVTALAAWGPHPSGATAADLLTEILAVRPHDRLRDVLLAWVEAHCEAVLVTDGRRVVGVLTEHDACRIGSAVLDDDERVGAHAATVVIRAAPDEPARAALDRMRDRGVRHLLVTGSGDRLVGVVSLRDLVRRRVDERTDLSVRDVLCSDVTWTAAPHEPMSVAAARMVTLGVGCMPVLSALGRIVGVVTRVDVLRALLSSELAAITAVD